MKFTKALAAFALLVVASVSAFAKPVKPLTTVNTIYSYNTTVAAQIGSLATITVDGDVRTFPGSDPALIELGFGDTAGAFDTEVWFADASAGSVPGNSATAAKVISTSYDAGTGNTTILIVVPDSGNGWSGGTNPYIQVMQDLGGSYSQYREFRPGSPSSNGGLLVTNRPQILFDGDHIVGFIKDQNKFSPILNSANSSVTLIDPNGEIPLVTIFVFGWNTNDSGTVKYNCGGSDFTPSESQTLNANKVAEGRINTDGNVSALTFELVGSCRPSSGNTKTITVSVKNTSAGTYSTSRQFKIATQ